MRVEVALPTLRADERVEVCAQFLTQGCSQNLVAEPRSVPWSLCVYSLLLQGAQWTSYPGGGSG